MKTPFRQTPRPSSWWWSALGTLVLTVLVASTVSALLALMVPDVSLPGVLVVSHAVGLSMWACGQLVARFLRGRIRPGVMLLLVTPAASLLGFEINGLMGFYNPLANPWHGWRTILTSLLLVFVSSLFILRHLAASEYRAGLDAERRRAAEARQAEALARLALLQAQIEPHFLFNTLANVRSMVDRDPRTAGRMLDLLNSYLRSSLGRTRAPLSSCGEEMQLLGALLGIAAIRLGSRLRYEICLPEDLRSARLPPLLVQPLVENALTHGIEPSVEGGEVRVECVAQAGRLLVRVRDTGMGFQETAPAGGGLSNIRSRLASLYGPEGQLALYRNEPRGTVAELTLPLQEGR